MCDTLNDKQPSCTPGYQKVIPIEEAVGLVLAHDLTEMNKGEFKGRAFKKGHVIRQEDLHRLRSIGKEHLYVLDIPDSLVHEDDAAIMLAQAITGPGVVYDTNISEGKVNLRAGIDGLLKINKAALTELNMTGDIACATLHDSTTVKQGEIVAGIRAIPLLIERTVLEDALSVLKTSGPLVEVRELFAPKVGLVITGSEIYYGRKEDAFEAVITQKVLSLGGEIAGVRKAPDDAAIVKDMLTELLGLGANVLITTGGMSVDPDDVTRFAIRNLGVTEMHYGSPVLPGNMFLVAYTQAGIPVLGIPACGMFHKVTVFDLIFPRILAGEKITRRTLAEMGHGGLCLHCKVCNFPVCPFGK